MPKILSGKQQDISIENFKKHVMKHLKLVDKKAKEMAVWAQHEGPISACHILGIPTISVDDFLDDLTIDVQGELFIDEGDFSLRPVKKGDVLAHVLRSFPRRGKDSLAKAIMCVGRYADLFCRATFNTTLPN